MSVSKIVIDPTSRILYASYYIQGLYDVFGKKNISFSRKHFSDLNRSAEKFAFEHFFAFMIIEPDGSAKKIAVDFCDPPDISEIGYDWCDHYAKINFNPRETDKKFLDKIIVIPPGFGIKIWNKWETLYHCFSNLVKCRFSSIVSNRRFLEDYYLQFKRPALSDYDDNASNIQSNAEEPYVYMIATLWSDDEKISIERKAFIELVKSQHCIFEGGFFADKSHPRYNQYKEFAFETPCSSIEYVEKSKRSHFVFNTPAVHNCHGWKLGEYLAMGKAIISTPLSNELPESLRHGEHIHIVSTRDELGSAISILKHDPEYKQELGRHAKSYFEEFVKPKAVIQNLVRALATKERHKATQYPRP